MIIKSRAVLFDEGWTPADIAGAVRRGELLRVASGRYGLVDGELPSKERQHVALARATTLSGGHHFIDETAALLLGLPVLDVPPLLQIGCRGDGTSWRRQDRIVRSTPQRCAAVDSVEGLPVSTPTRTVLDIACRRGIEAGAVVGDQALRRGLTTMPKLEVMLARYGGRAGVARARRMLPLLDACSESVGETRSRLAIRGMDLPSPSTQVVVTGEGGVTLGRLDFAWEEQRVAGEFDGAVKYRGTFGKQPVDVIREQHRRQAELERAGWTVVRWTWEDLDRPWELEKRLRLALRRRAA